MKRSVFRGIGATAAVATAAMWAEAPVGADDGPLADPDPPSPEEVAALQAEVPRALDLSDALTARFPDSFAGLDVIRETQETVLRFDERAVSPSADEIAAVAADFGYPAGTYSLGTATWTRAALLDVEERLLEVFPDAKLGDGGGRYVGYGVVEDLGVVQIGVVDIDPDRATEILAEHVPQELISVTTAHDLTDGWADRANDTSPFNGGNLITKPNGGVCTSGWVVSKGGTRRTLTASHCGEAKWYNGPNNLFVGDTDGSVVPLSSTSGGSSADAALIEGASINDKTWRHWNVRVRPTHAVAPAKDTYVCFGGAVTAYEQIPTSEPELCGFIDVTDANREYSGPHHWSRYLSCIHGGRFIGQPGDSGGPVYWDNAFGLSAAGIIKGPDPLAPSGQYGSCFTQIEEALYFTGSTIVT